MCLNEWKHRANRQLVLGNYMTIHNLNDNKIKGLEGFLYWKKTRKKEERNRKEKKNISHNGQPRSIPTSTRIMMLSLSLQLMAPHRPVSTCAY